MTKITRKQVQAQKKTSKFWPSSGALGSQLYWVHVSRIRNPKISVSDKAKSKKVIKRIQTQYRKKGWTFVGNIPQAPKTKLKR